MLFHDPAPTEIYSLSLHDALPIFFREDCTDFVERAVGGRRLFADSPLLRALGTGVRVGDPALPLLRRDVRLEPRASLEEHTSEFQSRQYLVCRLLLVTKQTLAHMH